MTVIKNLLSHNNLAGLITIILLSLVLLMLWKKQKSAHKIALESKASTVLLKIALGVAAVSVVLTVVTNFI